MSYAVHVLLITLYLDPGVTQQDMKNYGPYEIIWELLETCKGPKQRDCGSVQLENTQNMSDVIFLLDFLNDCPATMGKIVLSTRVNNNTKKLVNYAMDKPCEHFVMGPILSEAFNLTKSCKINKGRYEIHLDYAAQAMKFLGTNFFYGTYIFQVMSYNKLNNFFCVKAILDFKKPSN